MSANLNKSAVTPDNIVDTEDQDLKQSLDIKSEDKTKPNKEGNYHTSLPSTSPYNSSFSQLQSSFLQQR